MQRARLFEIVGAFALGGGVVAVGYELARGPGVPVASALGEDSEDEPGEAEVGRDDDAAPSGMSALGRASQRSSGEAGEAGEGSDDPSMDRPPHLVPDESGSYSAFPPMFDTSLEFDDEAEATYAKHALVTSVAAIVRERADLESPIIGIVRGGTRLRVDGERAFGGGCREGWNRVFPRGWICRAAKLEVEDTPPDDGVVSVPQPDLDSPLPYEYWRVNDEMTPFFHRLPSFEEQDRADAAGQAWYAERGREPMPTHPEQRPSDVPAVVKEYMNAGYYVTKGGEEVKSQRRFLRTLRGAYARKYQLGTKEGSTFKGRILSSEEDLPLYYITRELTLQKRESEGSDVLVDSDVVPKRLEAHPFVRKVNIGPKEYYEDADGLLIRTYAVGRAYKLKRPPGVSADERWIHVDLSQQTLVAYDGDQPVFATLVSTGKQPGMTPTGVHRVQIKHVATPMRDQPVEDEAYSIDDVPWTQYFHGSIALHGAFWHGGFGLVRSHGCVNLSPPDARWLFGFTDPPLPDGWHAAAPTRGTVKGSAVVITE
jgi:hypothetical protein